MQLVCFTALVEFTEADEALADQALLGDVFLFMKEGIMGCETFGQEEFYIRRFHSLITDFLALMPMKVRQERFNGDKKKSCTFLCTDEVTRQTFSFCRVYR